MKTVIGCVQYYIAVECPFCGGITSVEHGQDYSDDICLDLFGRLDAPAKWSGIEHEVTCMECDKKFLLTGFVT